MKVLSIRLYKLFSKIKSIWKKWVIKNQNEILINEIRKSGGKVGNGVKLGYNVRISGYDKIVIGNNVHIGSNTFIRAEGGLIIEDNVILSRNIVIYTTSHNYEGNLLPFDSTFLKKSVIIRKNSWVGMNVTISPGTEVGAGSIVGLGTRVFGKIDDLAIVGSSKPNVLKYRNSKHYNELDSKKYYAKEDGRKLNQ